jgi:hypothetical protein
MATPNNGVNRTPDTVFLTLGVSRLEAFEMGMLGCGLQLNSLGDFSWADTTISLDPNKEEVKIFLALREVNSESVPSFEGITRISIQDMQEYVSLYETIQEFLGLYRRNRFLRLGRSARVSPECLDSRQAFIIRMSESDFNDHFIADPRGQLSFAQMANPSTFLHEPLMKKIPQGLPDPGKGGWI